MSIYRFAAFKAALLLLVSGCGTIIHGTQKTVTIQSDPAGAEVYSETNTLLGITPLELSKLQNARQVYNIRKSGFEEEQLAVVRKLHKGTVFLDAMLLCIPCIIDFPNGSLNYYVVSNPVVPLKKKITGYENTISVAIGEAMFEFDNTVPLGKLNGKEKSFGAKGFDRMTGNVENIDETVIEVLKNSYLKPVYQYQLEKENVAFQKTRILIKPVITKIDFNYKGKLLSEFEGNGNIVIKWKIYKSFAISEPVAEIITSTAAQRYSENKSYIFDQLVADATRDFLDIDTLYSYLSKVEKAYYEDLKGDSIVVHPASVTNFSSTKEVLKNATSAVVTIEQEEGFGSGFIISRDGFIITNYHVVGNNKNVSIKLSQDIKLNGTVVKTNKDFDLALLKIDAHDLKALILSNSEMAELGDDVYAIGTPVETSLGQTITKGIISGIREMKGMKFIQTDVSISPGNSGGPLINDKGQVIGVTTMKLVSEGADNIGFCIPSNSVIEMLNIKFSD